MRTVALVRFVVCMSVATALLAGCGGSQPPAGAPGMIPQAWQSRASRAVDVVSQRFRVLYDFRGHGDGAQPGRLVAVGGLLYGAAYAGPGSQNGGIVFVITPTGKERVLWHPKNGVVPPGNLTALHRVLYGTARSTIFSLTPSGVERTLYSLRKDQGPSSLLITANRTFYGTSYSFSRHRASDGSIFKIDHSGVERVLYSFPRDGSKGAKPNSLLLLNGTFYGTTFEGGANGDGTVFALSPSGALRVVHNFGAGNDGSLPSGGLIAIDDVLYGTTESGGSVHHCQFPTGPPSADPCGTIFSVTPSGRERVLYNFQNDADSANPNGLIDVAETLYGTAYGDPADGAYQVGGSVFSMTPPGTFRVLHAFSSRNNKDGSNPAARLTELNGTLYGTTQYGGKYDQGTVFQVQP
jgi:uncharacterized repeat protein (TIGR03803 family)